MKWFKASVEYFLWVFAAGFVLGVIRELWLNPSLGSRFAELAEMPVMLVVIVVAARWTTRRFALSSPASRWAVGMLAVGWLLLAEVTLVLGLHGMTLVEYVAARDPVAGTAYAVSLLLMAAMPWLVGRAGR